MTNEIAMLDAEKEVIAITNQLLAESGVKYKRQLKLNASFRHLGIDSLGRAELFQRIEKKFHVTVPDRLLMESETLEDIVDYLQEASPEAEKMIHHDVVTSHGERPHLDPQHAKSLIDVLLLYGEQSPDKAHIYFQHEDGQEEVITYGQLLTLSRRIAYAMKERGIKEGDTVAIMQPTNPGFFYTFFGVLLAGGIPVPIYPPFRMHMLEAYAKTEAHILKSAEVRMLVTFEQAENLSRLLQGFVPSLKEVVTVDDLLKTTTMATPFKATAENFAFIQYTSGSTSDPKGVLLSHHNLLSNIRAYGKAIQITQEDVAVSWLPLYHDLGLIGMWLGSLYHGIPLILMTPFSFLNRPERWLWAIHHHRATLSGAPNFAYELCIKKIDPAMLEGLDLSSWRVAANGAEKIYPRTLEQFAEKFAPYGFKHESLLPVYGLAESTVGLTVPPLGREFRIDYVDKLSFEEQRRAVPSEDKNALAYVSCGVALEGHEIRIVNDEGKVLPERHIGTLQFRGPSNMQGYYHNQKATAAVYRDGWIDSGDLAYQADGELFVTGRRKDLIIKAGRNLYPSEIEEYVGKVEGVRDGCVAVFGATDPERGTEQLIVVAETRETNKAKRETISDNIKEILSTTIDVVPDHVVLVVPHTVPKTSSGKLQRAACKTMYLENKLDKFHLPAWMQITKLSMAWLGRKIQSIFTRIAKFIYTVYFALLVLISIVPLYFIVRRSSQEKAGKICRAWARGLLTVAFCPLKIVGESYLHEAPIMVFAANHASYLDALATLAFAPANARFVGKKEIFSTPILGTFLKKLNYISVDRADLTKSLEDTKRMEQALRAGESIFIFPEGTFGYAAGLRPFKFGAFKIASEAGVPVCPVSLQGMRSILRDNEMLMRPKRIVVVIGKPVQPRGTEWQDITYLRDEVRAEIAKHCGEPSLDFIAAQTVAPRLPR